MILQGEGPYLNPMTPVFCFVFLNANLTPQMPISGRYLNSLLPDCKTLVYNMATNIPFYFEDSSSIFSLGMRTNQNFDIVFFNEKNTPHFRLFFSFFATLAPLFLSLSFVVLLAFQSPLFTLEKSPPINITESELFEQSFLCVSLAQFIISCSFRHACFLRLFPTLSVEYQRHLLA